MAKPPVKSYPARSKDVTRKLKDFLKDHFLRYLPATPAVSSVQPGLVSCLMMTRGNVAMVRQALASFNDQTWPHREMILVTVNMTDELRQLIQSEGQGNVKLVHAQNHLSMGEQRNLTLAHSQGEFICIWDDDDLYSPERIQLSIQALQDANVDAVFLSRLLLWWPTKKRLAVSFKRLWENTMLARRTAVPAYVATSNGEDAIMVEWLTLHSSHALIDAPELYAYRITGENHCSSDHFERLFAMSDELHGERQNKFLESACFHYAEPAQAERSA